MKEYDPSSVEKKWQEKWEEKKVFEVDFKKAKDPYYCLVMFPYPSGSKLHVGHWFQYSVPDSFARFKKMQGKDVFHPIGFDAFGLPAENNAIKKGKHPHDSTQENVDYIIKQFKRMGCMYDWNKTLNTSEKEYYKWTQWLFLQMFKNDLAYRKEGNVNFCPSCQTVLANEQVWDGKCERCESEVEQKPLTQWYWKITDYSDQLLEGLEEIDWPKKTKLMQKNWIGKSEGCDVSWKVKDTDIVLNTYTTTVDTLYGVTFVVISPEHPELENIVKDECKKRVEKYKQEAAKKTEINRMAEGKEKTGVDTGAKVIHPFTGKEIDLWVADYVLMNFGTGVVMGVPAHDQRDMDFAKKYGFEIVQSIKSDKGESFVYDDIDKYNVKGSIVDSGSYSGMDIVEGRKAIISDLEKQKKGCSKIQFKIRDWLISRQRYWGAPIPIVYDPEGNPHPIPEKHLPWELPNDVEFKPKGKSPLAQSKELVKRVEKIFGKGWTPEVDTMDTFVCSSFYEYRFLAEGSQKKFIPKSVEKNWMPVDFYIGGPEHACMHLIYARFVSMALKDFGFAEHSEPFKKLLHQGLITKDGSKMSKRGNVVSPDEFVEKYGSDVLRLYMMFMGPFMYGGDWSDTGIKGLDRFVRKAYKLIVQNKYCDQTKALTAGLHKTIKKVTEEVKAFRFNTAIAALMEFLNLTDKEGIDKESALTFIKLLAPLAPHLAEELWEKMEGPSSANSRRQSYGRQEATEGKKGFVIEQDWPKFDPKLIKTDTITIAVQVNGKLRGEFEADADVSKEDAIKVAKEVGNVKKFLDGKKPKKEIYVEGRLVNLVV